MVLSQSPQYVVFGDSWADNGNLYRVTEGLLSDGYRDERTGYFGRASNGPVFTEYLDRTPGYGATLNYAVSAATASGDRTLRDYAIENNLTDRLEVPLDDPRLDWDMNLDGQVARFRDDVAGQDAGQVTAFLHIGANDYNRVSTDADPLSLLLDVIGTMLGTVDAIVDAAWDLDRIGVGNVKISGLAYAPFLPGFALLDASVQNMLQDAVDQHNSLLQDNISFARFFGLDAEYYDMTSITAAFVEDPTQFGILAPWELTMTEAPAGSLAAYDESQIAFWDGIHPGASVHAILGAWASLDIHRPTLGDLDDTYGGRNADEAILTYAGNDNVTMLGGRDLAFLGSGDDTASMGAGQDMANGGAGNDTLYGGTENDVLAGGLGADTVKGGRGDDVLIDAEGDDWLEGNNDDDTFVFFQSTFIGGADSGRNTLIGGRGQDRLVLVLDQAGADAFGASASQKAALVALGITAKGIEGVEVVTGLDGLAGALGASDWWDDAQLWNML